MFCFLAYSILSMKICYGSKTLCGADFADDEKIIGSTVTDVNEIILYQDLEINESKLNANINVKSGDHRIPKLAITGGQGKNWNLTIGNISVALSKQEQEIENVVITTNSTFVANNRVINVKMNLRSTLDASEDLTEKIEKIDISYGKEIYNYTDLMIITRTAATVIGEINVNPESTFKASSLNESSFQIPFLLSPVDLTKKMKRSLNHKDGTPEVAYETLIKTSKVKGEFVHYVQYSKVTTDLTYIYICIGVAAFLIIVAIIIYCLLCKTKVDDGEEEQEALIQKEAEEAKPPEGEGRRRRRHKKEGEEGETGNPADAAPANAEPATA